MSAAAPTRRIYLVRHAHAGDRSEWRGDDSRRPLSDKGRRQSEGIARLLAGERVDRVVSSPSLRCVQTLEPLARARSLGVEEDEALLEGNHAEDALDSLAALVSPEGAVVACTHGDIVPGVLDLLRSAGATVQGPLQWPKASTWVLDGGGGAGGFARLSYLPPP